MAAGNNEQKIYGAIVLTRFQEVSGSAGIRNRVAAFRKAHSAFKQSMATVESAEAKVETANKAIAASHDKLRTQIEPLVTVLVTTGVTSRVRPFAKISDVSPSTLAKVAAPQAVSSARSIVKKIRGLSPKKQLETAVDKFSSATEALATALGGLTKPSSAQKRAYKARDKARAALDKALAALKAAAVSEWIDDKDFVKTLFAPPDKEQAPKKRSRKKKNAGDTKKGKTPPAAAKGAKDKSGANDTTAAGANGANDKGAGDGATPAAKPVDGAPPVAEAEKVADFVKAQNDEEESETETDTTSGD